MPNDKIKITKEDFETLYEVEDTKDLSGTKEVEKDNTEPEFLTEEEQQFDDNLFEDLPKEIKE